MEDNHPSPRADLIGGVAWIAFGLAIVAGSLAMDRLEQFGATLHTVPGLVPGLLGALIALLGGILVVRSLRRGATPARAAAEAPAPDVRTGRMRAAIATALSLVYTLGLIGRVPFSVASVLFIFAFIMVFDVSPERPRGLARRALFAGIAAIATTAVVAFVFERIFLVRLP
jgi:putative tricarboxylic transport membrane protein